MRVVERLAKHRQLAIPVILLVVAVIAFGLVWTSRGASKTQEGVHRRIRKDLVARAELKTTSKVAGFDVLKVEKHLDENHIYVYLQNNTSKPITGYQIGVGIVIEGMDLLAGDNPEMIPPGAVVHEVYPIQPELETRGVAVLGAVFEDGSTAGDAGAVKDLIEGRQGMKIQCDYSARQLRRLAELSDSEMFDEARNLESKVAALSTEQEKDLPHNIQSGYRYQVALQLHQMHVTLQRAKTLQDPSQAISEPQHMGSRQELQNFRQELQSLAARYEKQSSLLTSK